MVDRPIAKCLMVFQLVRITQTQRGRREDDASEAWPHEPFTACISRVEAGILSA